MACVAPTKRTPRCASANSPALTAERFLTTDQLAEKLGVVPATLFLWTRRQKNPLPYYKIGGLVRFDPLIVESWIMSCRVQGAPAPRPRTPKARKEVGNA